MSIFRFYRESEGPPLAPQHGAESMTESVTDHLRRINSKADVLAHLRKDHKFRNYEMRNRWSPQMLREFHGLLHPEEAPSIPGEGLTDWLCRVCGAHIEPLGHHEHGDDNLTAVPTEELESGLDVERIRRVFHKEYETSDNYYGCRHQNQHRSTWDCQRRVEEFVAQYRETK